MKQNSGCKLRVLFFLAALLWLTSCGKDKPGQTHRLEGVYLGTQFVLSENEKPLASVLPYIDADRDRVLCASGIETGNMADLQSEVTVYACALNEETMKPLWSFSVKGMVLCGAVSADGIVLITTTEDTDGNRIYNYVRATGDTSPFIVDISKLLSASVSHNFYGVAEDNTGNIYLLTQDATLIFSSDLSNCEWIDIQHGERLIRGNDGSVWVLFVEKAVHKIARMDSKSDQLVETISLPVEAYDVWFGKGSDYCYAMPNGIFRHVEGEKDTLLMHYVNSGLSSTVAKILAVPDSEHILLIRHRADIGSDLLSLYRKAGDEEVQKTIIEIAFGSKISNRYFEKILLFNEAHDDIHVSVKDYSIYNTVDDSEGGGRHLSIDILTGAYSPDLVVGQFGIDSYMNMCVEKGLYTDLLPYLEHDTNVNTTTVFPCLLRTYDNGEGGIWGMTDRFWIDFLIGYRNKLGISGVEGKWTVHDLLDYCEDLPEESELISSLSQANAMQYLLGPEGYGAFIDMQNGVCTFTSKDFLELLSLVKRLPEKSIANNDQSLDPLLKQTESVRKLQDGRTILWRVRTSTPAYDFLRTKLYFSKGEVIPIGYPTSGISGNVVRAESSWIITSFGDHQDLSWELLSFIIREREKDSAPHCTALISDFDRNSSDLYDVEYYVYYDGLIEGKIYDSENPTIDNDLPSPGIVARYTEVDHEMVKTWISKAGTPLIHSVPEQVKSIIDEEISYYMGGAYTPERCAEIIQSRVSIWLSEHE